VIERRVESDEQQERTGGFSFHLSLIAYHFLSGAALKLFALSAVKSPGRHFKKKSYARRRARRATRSAEA
jgi:hypothetical protein